jgi:hypothetical protein
MNPGVNLILIKLILSLFFPVPESNGDNLDEIPLRQEAYLIYSSLVVKDLSFETFCLAYEGYNKLLGQHCLIRDSILTIIDYSQPSDHERLFVIDLKNQKLLFKSLVAHGKGSGEKNAESFSNQPFSHQSCLGFFITGDSYFGKHGYSLRIKGMENGINSNALSRAIVFHEASYVSINFIEQNGRLGRSFGCPALPVEKNRLIIDTIKDASCVFMYAREESYFKKTNLINSSLYSQTIAE